MKETIKKAAKNGYNRKEANHVLKELCQYMLNTAEIAEKG
ncbi:hypothetical protein THIOSC13_420010 [uncultured Thiomicrorhabdus sp.]